MSCLTTSGTSRKFEIVFQDRPQTECDHFNIVVWHDDKPGENDPVGLMRARNFGQAIVNRMHGLDPPLLTQGTIASHVSAAHQEWSAVGLVSVNLDIDIEAGRTQTPLLPEGFTIAIDVSEDQ